jgi:hypothetical protein
MGSIIHTKGITSKNGLISSEIGRGGQDFFYTLYLVISADEYLLCSRMTKVMIRKETGNNIILRRSRWTFLLSQQTRSSSSEGSFAFSSTKAPRHKIFTPNFHHSLVMQSTVSEASRCWYQYGQQRRELMHDEFRCGRPRIDIFDIQILSSLEKSHFHSVCLLIEILKASNTMILNHLGDMPAVEHFHLRWVLQQLTEQSLWRLTRVGLLLNLTSPWNGASPVKMR